MPLKIPREIYYYARKNEHQNWQLLTAKSTIAAREEIKGLEDGHEMREIGRSYKVRQLPKVVFIRNKKWEWVLKVPRPSRRGLWL